ncbi:DUF788-domain-containing protein [Rhizophagus irregularis]|uniref:DUF788-domain-containing protein n=1 Tax=Rhizophagus irregularis TaxID=588596 RepID=A0A2I1FX50_9GLOM|nr:DUF788-domain-containing protein [Rhizophagus irregularis]PKC67597.1 DUF788-domain-containing protein [Rhizophagus irregularis]PKK78454.1 DUF788-domain-containing protein [Rhizophagus irregularis]PKY26217.1 DUF788-domain-containing protein [Rhizophagus irregularis]PKY38969.1 DUF788-domain-containing protein [Rhizophagus irregularis]
MAKQSDKKIAQENLRYLRNLKQGFLTVNAIYILYQVLYNYNTFTFWLATGYLVTTGISLFLWKQLVIYGSPRYSSDGTVIWPGEDLNSEGLTAYMFDIIYITWFVHITSMFFAWAWYILLVIPSFAIYKIWTFFIKPNFFSGGNMAGSDFQKSKRQKKLEKRQQEGNAKIKYARI